MVFNISINNETGTQKWSLVFNKWLTWKYRCYVTSAQTLFTIDRFVPESKEISISNQHIRWHVIMKFTKISRLSGTARSVLCELSLEVQVIYPFSHFWWPSIPKIVQNAQVNEKQLSPTHRSFLKKTSMAQCALYGIHLYPVNSRHYIM